MVPTIVSPVVDEAACAHVSLSDWTPDMPTLSPFGTLLRDWRSLRGVSQMDLAHMISTTPRHISFVETGRSRPGRDLVIRIAEGLNIDKRECNELLNAAGLSEEFSERPFSHVDLSPYRAAVEAVVERHSPYPACVLDRWGQVLLTNKACRALSPGIEGSSPEEALETFFAPGPGRDFILNWEALAWAYSDRVVRSAAAANDARLDALASRSRELLKDVPRPSTNHSALIPIRMQFPGQLVSAFATLMKFQTAQDVTLSELSIELIFPEDDSTAEFFRSLDAESSDDVNIR